MEEGVWKSNCCSWLALHVWQRLGSSGKKVVRHERLTRHVSPGCLQEGAKWHWRRAGTLGRCSKRGAGH